MPRFYTLMSIVGGYLLYNVLYPQVKDHLAYLFYIWAGTNIMASSFIKVILVEISVDGKQHVLEITV